MSETSQAISPEKIGWIARVLGVTLEPTSRSSPAAGLVALQQRRLAWDTTRKSVLAQLKTIEAAIISEVNDHNQDSNAEDEFDLGQVIDGMPRLYALLERYDERLIDKLDEAHAAQGEARERLNREAAAIVGEYQSFLGSDTDLDRIDNSGLAAPMRPIIQGTLSSLAKML